MKVLIVDEMHESIVQMPESLGLTVDYFPNLTHSEILKKVHDYEGLIIRSKFYIDEEFLNHATKLRFIGRAGAGLDLIDIEACEKRAIKVFAANEGNKVAVAEHLIGMLLSLLHKINLAHLQVKKGNWLREEHRGEELLGKTIGIIGYGNNGQATAERFAAFGCEILAYDKFKYGFGNHIVEECDLNDIFEKADVLSLHIPLTHQTEKMVNEAFLSKFKKNIYFCNISRGEIVQQSALISALKSGKVKGACLDVLENEKISKLEGQQLLDFQYLQNAENVIITPHVAGWTHQSYQRINKVLKDKIKRWLQQNQ